MRGVDNILSESWATYEFKGLDFGDERLNSRFKQTAESISKRPTASLSMSAQKWSQAKGTYRMFDNAKVTPDEILMSHQNALAARLDADPIVFAVQDTSFLNFTGHTQTEGLGRIGQRKAGDQLAMGVIVHSTLAVTPDGLPLGLLDQQVFARGLEKAPKYGNLLPIEDKESIRWLQAARQTHQVLPKFADKPRQLILISYSGIFERPIFFAGQILREVRTTYAFLMSV